MQETQIEVYLTENKFLLKYYLIGYFLIKKLGKFKLKNQKYKTIIECDLDVNSKLTLIKDLYFFNFFGISKIITTY